MMRTRIVQASLLFTSIALSSSVAHPQDLSDVSSNGADAKQVAHARRDGESTSASHADKSVVLRPHPAPRSTTEIHPVSAPQPLPAPPSVARDTRDTTVIPGMFTLGGHRYVVASPAVTAGTYAETPATVGPTLTSTRGAIPAAISPFSLPPPVIVSDGPTTTITAGGGAFELPVPHAIGTLTNPNAGP